MAIMLAVEITFLVVLSDSLIVAQLSPSYELKQTHFGLLLKSTQLPLPEHVSFLHTSTLYSHKLPL
jgi:hypothetical protein